MSQDDNKTGLKINNSRSRFANGPAQAIDMEKKARDINSKMEGRKKEAYELGVRYLEILKDRTITQNKNQLARSVEKEVISNLMEFAVETNNDENEKEGMGSVAVCTLLFRSVLYLRDSLNELDYKLAKKEVEIKNLKDQIEKMSSKGSTDNETK